MRPLIIQQSIKDKNTITVNEFVKNKLRKWRKKSPNKYLKN